MKKMNEQYTKSRGVVFGVLFFRAPDAAHAANCGSYTYGYYDMTCTTSGGVYTVYGQNQPPVLGTPASYQSTYYQYQAAYQYGNQYSQPYYQPQQQYQYQVNPYSYTQPYVSYQNTSYMNNVYYGSTASNGMYTQYTPYRPCVRPYYGYY